MLLATLLFLPLVSFYAYLAFSKQVTYKKAVLPLAGAYFLYVGGALLIGPELDWWWYIAQGVTGAVLFFLLVALMGRVASADAVLSVVAAIMITPLWWPVAAVFAGGVLLAATVALVKWNRSQETKLTLKGAAFQSLLSLGVGMRISPDLDGVPRAADYSADLRVLASRWFLLVAVIVTGVYAGIQMLFG